MTLYRNGTYDCYKSTNATGSNNSTSPQQNLHAVLYIVVTLLFYSLGIIIGIVLYLKREKQECEEDKLYDEFIALREDPFSAFRFQQVQQVAARLNYLQRQKKIQHSEINLEKGDKVNSRLHLKHDDCVKASLPTVVNCVENKIDKYTASTKMDPKEDSELFSENGEPLASMVEKLLKDTSSTANNETDKASGVPQTFSMQSIKDYEEEPRRSERSSMCSNDGEDLKIESDKLLSEDTDNVFKTTSEGKGSVQEQTRCIVTNV